MFDTLIHRIAELSESQADKVAVAFKKETLTYSELYSKIQNIGSQIADLGVCKGDRVLFTALSKPEMVAVYLGIQYIGAIAVFMDKNSTPENAVAIYEDAEATLFLTDKPMKDYAQNIRVTSLKQIYQTEYVGEISAYVMPTPETMAELLFTTGTTGKPKGVILTYKSVYNILANTIEGIGICENERVLLPLPLNHSYALRVLRATLYAGATVVLQNGFAFAKEIEVNQEAWDCTALAAVPASMEILRGQMQDKFIEIMSRFRYIEIGAGSLTIEQRKRLTAQLPNTVIYNTWGSSETGGALFTNVTEVAKDPVKVGAVGKPLPHVEVRVLDAEGNVIESDKDHPGRMSLRGDMQMAGYWHREELTKETLKDGWLLTSDMVYLDAEGYVYMLGRADDIINVGGEKVSPIEVENIASEYAHLRECACIGVPDPEGVLGFVPVLLVAVKDNAFSEADLQTFLAQRMERYKLPAHYMIVEELPRNRMQKLDRKTMREMWDNRKSTDLMNPVMQAILTRRSVRKFSDREIPSEILDMILKAGYYAPTGHNMQTWRFTVITDQTNIQALKTATIEAAKNHNVLCYGFENPKVLVLISNDSRNVNGCQDAACAAENMFLAAHSYGIGSVWLNPLRTLRQAEPVKALLDQFGVPENHVVWCTAAFGYPVTEPVTLAKKKDVIYYVDERA